MSSRILADNRTRRSRSIVRKLLREGSLHWLPLYALLMQSDLGREGIINSGSYRFADHIYRNQPSGRGPFGRWIDAFFLGMPATQAFHRRYKRCQDELGQVASEIPAPGPIRVLAIPCGIPRDIAEFCQGLDGNLKSRIHYYGMDLDPQLLQIAKGWVAPLGLGKFEFIHGNALIAEDYPKGSFDFVVSTGLGEFLKTDEIETFYRNVHRVLAPGGVFYTSATRGEKRSESFLKTFELLTQYRTIDHLDALFDSVAHPHHFLGPAPSLQELRDISGIYGSEDRRPTCAPPDLEQVDTVGAELGEDQPVVIDQLGNSARFQDRYDAVKAEPTPARCAPDV